MNEFLTACIMQHEGFAYFLTGFKEKRFLEKTGKAGGTLLREVAGAEEPILYRNIFLPTFMVFLTIYRSPRISHHFLCIGRTEYVLPLMFHKCLISTGFELVSVEWSVLILLRSNH